MSDLQADIVLFTVNEHETAQIQKAFAFTGKTLTKTVDDLTFPYDDFGVVAGARVVHIRTPMADLKTIQFARHAFHAWQPGLLVAVGIAWGSKKLQNGQEQAIGDILVAATLHDAAHHKNKLGEIQPRGDAWKVSESVKRIVDASYQSWRWQSDAGFAQQTSKPKLYCEDMISLPELIDDKNLRDKLLETWPHACGGEMEGRGLVSEAVQAKTEWLIVKAVCDWGFDKNINHALKECDQVQAAYNSAIFLHFAIVNGLAQHALAQPRKPQSPRKDEDKVKEVTTLTQNISGTKHNIFGSVKNVYL